MISIPDGKRIAEKLKALEPKVARRMLRGSIRDGTKVIAGEIKQRIRSRTGKLAASITVRAGKRRGRKGRKAVTMSVVSRGNIAPYLGFVEYGHGTPRGGRVQGRFYMKRSAAAVGPRAVNVTVARLRTEIQQEGKKKR